MEKNYRAETDSKNRALAGLSMGGIQTLYAGINNTDLFGYLGVFSSGWRIPSDNKLAEVQYDYLSKNADKVNSNLKLLWIATGSKEDGANPNSKAMIANMMNLKLSIHIANIRVDIPGRYGGTTFIILLSFFSGRVSDGHFKFLLILLPD